MRTIFSFAVIALAISFSVGGFVSTAHADEAKLTQLNTSLTSYSIGSMSFDDSYSPSSSDPLAPSVASFSLTPSAVPEPTTLFLLSAGALALLAAKRRIV